MIKLVKGIFYILWRCWFYVLVGVPIIIMFPFLLIFSSREQWYPHFFWMARNIWANVILYGMGFYPKITYQEPLEKGKSYMLIANHASMIDIMLMLKASKNPFVFVGKKELVKIPLFGFFYKRSSIMVDRSSTRSRTAVYMRAKKRLDSGLSICIFPEGGVPDENVVLDSFKDGAFKLAIDYQIPIVPMSFLDCKKRYSWKFFSGSPGKLRVLVHKFIPTKGLIATDKIKLKETSWQLLYNSLKQA
jgi:1-acyl-sn-glycerol-3-phosphate acyltransferase